MGTPILQVRRPFVTAGRRLCSSYFGQSRDLPCDPITEVSGKVIRRRTEMAQVTVRKLGCRDPAISCWGEGSTDLRGFTW